MNPDSCSSTAGRWTSVVTRMTARCARYSSGRGRTTISGSTWRRGATTQTSPTSSRMASGTWRPCPHGGTRQPTGKRRDGHARTALRDHLQVRDVTTMPARRYETTYRWETWRPCPHGGTRPPTGERRDGHARTAVRDHLQVRDVPAMPARWYETTYRWETWDTAVRDHLQVTAHFHVN